MDQIATAHPLSRSGGLFLVVAGLGFLFAWSHPARFRLFAGLAIGLGAAAAACGLALRPSLGAPTPFQIATLWLGVAIEGAGIVWAARHLRRDARTRDLVILLVVGLHFLPMYWAIGPLVVVLGLACVANAWIALRVRRHAPARPFCLFDSLIKAGFGTALVAAQPVHLA